MTASMLNANAPRHFGLTEADDSWSPCATDADAVLDALIAEAEADAQRALHIPRVRWPYEPAPSRRFADPAERVHADVDATTARFPRESRYSPPLPVRVPAKANADWWVALACIVGAIAVGLGVWAGRIS